MSDREIAVRAERVRLSAGDRRVYPATTFEIPAGTVATVLGASGTGKTSLLLTIAGRMRGWHGSASVDRIDVARHSARVRGLVGMGVMAGVNDLAEALTPAQHVVEAHVFVPRSKRSGYRDVLAEVGLEAAANIQVKHLDAEQRIRLGIALAIVRDVRVIVIGDLDRDLNQEERSRVLALLHGLADDGLTVLFACIDEATAKHADMVISVEDVEPISPISSREVSADAVA
jgi:ABC-type multidrug transport system ATPase subunit